MKARYTAVGGYVLVLLTDRLAQKINFDMTGLLGEFNWMNEISVEGMERLEEAVVKLPEEPRPVPDGMSAILAISR